MYFCDNVILSRGTPDKNNNGNNERYFLIITNTIYDDYISVYVKATISSIEYKSKKITNLNSGKWSYWSRGPSNNNKFPIINTRKTSSSYFGGAINPIINHQDDNNYHTKKILDYIFDNKINNRFFTLVWENETEIISEQNYSVSELNIVPLTQCNIGFGSNITTFSRKNTNVYIGDSLDF